MNRHMPTTEKVACYREEIVSRNCHSFLTFTFGGMLITGLILLTGILLRSHINFVKEYLFFFLYMTALHILARLCSRRKPRQITLIFYAALLPIYICGILMGTFYDPERSAITIMVLICILTLFIIDKPLRICAYIGLICVIFAVCCKLSKEPALFLSDMINLLIYAGIGMGVNYFTLRDRVENVENYSLLQQKSERDSLTELFHRGAGEHRIERLLEHGVQGIFVLLDIDEFKKINDTYGHQMGDEVLCLVADELSRAFRSADIVWRLGGDEFAVFAVGLTDFQLLQKKFELLNERLSNIQTSNPACCSIHLSAGCTICSNSAATFDELYHTSDQALYTAKRMHKGSCCLYRN